MKISAFASDGRVVARCRLIKVYAPQAHPVEVPAFQDEDTVAIYHHLDGWMRFVIQHHGNKTPPYGITFSVEEL